MNGDVDGVTLSKRPTAVRASDADRDRIAALLAQALEEGRITPSEHGDRVGTAYAARTLDELTPLVADLPAGRTPRSAPGPAPAGHDHNAPARYGVPRSGLSRTLAAVFGSAVRRGRWRAGGPLHAVAAFGSVEIDLTEAFFDQQELVINAYAVCGGVEITVPENVTLRNEGAGVLGAFEVDGLTADDPRAPVVVVRGVALCGAVEAKPVRGRRVRDLRSSGD
ncbi:DUF1707 domain-containing protein [Streptomyces chumphonensis]|uniref:DUF1707 and DUF2154 domain-containing protein n=1 Tax=Streptomyces chumphonensis TaxID=1214925 RepID=A0A927IDX5_9ACTN|nr:DUF1707 and DUF2154 domain-containing protein [Streptomyces chumphonensis]MBD3933587.1 DUF1707 and DUF2154 domain-containing protein [Streptomyces chumphonensis]